MSSETNPQIEKTLDELAELICQSLKGEESELLERRDQLLKTLVMSGFVWKADRTVMQQVEERVKDLCVEPAMHRGGAISSATSDLQKRFEEIASFESNTPANAKSPADEAPPQAANISSAREA